MTILHTLAQHWLVQSLGWTLLHFCWQGAIVAAVLWCVLQLLSARPAQARYLAACAALALMVLLPLATFARVALAEYRLAAATGLATAPGLTVQAGMGAAATPWLTRVASALDPALPWILLLWVAGSALFLLRLSVGFSVTRRMRFLAVAPVSAQLLHSFLALHRRLGIARAVTLMTSALVEVPTVIGWLRPIILIPVSCFTGLSDAQIEAILSHELAHIRRHDYLVSVVQSVVEALLFYHPAVWWVSQQIRRERECCCDDLAVSIGGNALAYARALSTLEAKRSTYPQVILGANGGVLTMRIQRLLRSNELSPASPAPAVVVLALLVASTVAIATTARAQSSGQHAGQSISQPVIQSGEAVPAAPALALTPPLPPAPSPSAFASVRPPAAPMPPAAPAARPPAPPVPPPPAPPALPVVAPQQSGAVRVAGGVIAGQIVSKVQPVYPPDAKAAHISGAVVLHAIISKTGEIDSLQVISGPAELVSSAMEAVRQWKYKPYLLNGEPTEVDTTITVNYHFGGEDYTPPPPPPTAQNDGPDALGTVPRSIGGTVSGPIVLSAPEPQYSDDARANKISGSVLVHLWVDLQGEPTHVRVVRGIGHGLDERALAAVRGYKFKPAMENGKPVVVAMNVEVTFQRF